MKTKTFCVEQYNEKPPFGESKVAMDAGAYTHAGELLSLLMLFA